MLSYRNGKLYFRTTYDMVNVCRSIPGGVWDKKLSCWVYHPDAICDLFHHSQERDEAAVELYNKLKTREQVVRGLKKGLIPPTMGAPFMLQHQKLCLSIANEHERYAFFLDTGTGKTVLGLSIISANPGMKWLVICPKAIIRTAWIEDAARFFPNIQIRPLSRNFGKKELESYPDENTAQVFVVNPESLQNVIKKYGQAHFQGMIFDESVKLKNPTAKITKMVTEITSTMKKVYLMSGVPAPNSELEYFSQMKIISPAILGENFYKFRERYFSPYGYGGYDWKFNETRRGIFTAQLEKRSIFVSKEECLDLPPKTYIVRDVELSDEAQSYYNDMYKHQVLELGDVTTIAPNKLTQIMKLRQITSGYMIDGEGDRQYLHGDKFAELIDVLEEIGNKQVIIWCQFKNEIKHIHEMLGDRSITAYSESPSVDNSIKQFKEGNVQYIIAHPQTLKYGVTFTNCTYAVYYSLSYSYDDYAQSHDRIYRLGQNKKCTFIFLIARNTIDNIIYDVLRAKGDMVEAIKNMVKEV